MPTHRRLFPPWLLSIALLCVAGSGHAADATAESADDELARSILEKADRIRFPAEGFQVDVAITTTAAGKPSDERKYRVLARGSDNAVVMIVEPASERGQIMLMKGRDLWLFLPAVSQPVRLSMAQRLTGLVANSDIARVNFTGDYKPRLAATEKIAGEDHYVLELAAEDRSVTYPRVTLWVRKANHWPHKADFYSASGRLLRTCVYEGYAKMAGSMRPTRLVMEDAVHQGEESVLEYSGMKLRDLPDKIFTKDYLKKLE
jgi:outer membrane lipoprotein-sorting protein